MSKEPKIAGLKSIKITMEPGTYWWCSCGESKNQPFCDGSHKGTDFTPVEVQIDQEQMIPWCSCKYSEKGYRCDGAHKKLRDSVSVDCAPDLESAD